MDGLSDTQQLIRRYAESGAEEAFQELTVRYVDFVYSVARRRAGAQSSLVDDVVQVVFTDLARHAKGGSRLNPAKLGGWLHRHTCFVASTVLRGERRRQSREREAALMNEGDKAAPWQEVAPELDEAIDALSEADRQVVIGRFFEGRSLRDLAGLIGASEAAAQKRVSRAVERLRELLVRRGVVLSSAALASLIGVHAVEAAPAGMALVVSGAALGGAAVAGAGAGTMISFMNAKVVLAGTLLIAGVVATSMVVSRWQTEPLGQAPAPKPRVVERIEVPQGLAKPSQAAVVPGPTRIKARPRPTVNQVPEEATSLPSPDLEVSTERQPTRLEARTRVRMESGQTLVMGGWETAPGQLTFVFVTPQTDTGAAGVMLTSSFVEVPESLWQELGLGEFVAGGNDSSLANVIGGPEADIFLEALQGTQGVNVIGSPRVVVPSGQAGSMSISGLEAGEMSVNLVPELLAEGMELSVQASLAPVEESGQRGALETDQVLPPN